MRLFVCCFLIALLGSSPAHAGDGAFDRKLASYIFGNSWAFSDDLKKGGVEVPIDLSIDRDGKLLNAEVGRGTGSLDDDTGALAGLRRIQSYPPVPDNLEAPYKFSAVLVFVPPLRTGHVGYISPSADAIPASETTFRKQVMFHLREQPRILSREQSQHGNLKLAFAFTIGRDGTLLDATITTRSDIKAVDDETIAWLKRIQPFPKIPSELKAPMKLTVGIKFGLKGNDDEAKRKVNGVCRGC